MQLLEQEASAPTSAARPKPAKTCFIAGSWSDYKPQAMQWDGFCFVHSVIMGWQGFESFQILMDGSWNQRVYPSVPDANPFVQYNVQGPDAGGHGKNWTMGKPSYWSRSPTEAKATRGSRYKVKASVDDRGKVTRVFWQSEEEEEKKRKEAEEKKNKEADKLTNGSVASHSANGYPAGEKPKKDFGVSGEAKDDTTAARDRLTNQLADAKKKATEAVIANVPSSKYCVIGSWSGFQTPEAMEKDGNRFTFTLTLGSKGFESFLILLGGSWNTAIYPSMPNASPALTHDVLGPDDRGHGTWWTIGQREYDPDSKARPGAVYLISAILDSQAHVYKVKWDWVKTLTEVVYWGICDIKYDPNLPPDRRVQMLELGDGRSSSFSQHGEAIKEKFEKEFFMASSGLKRALLVENKKVTHDMFVQANFANLRPLTACYPRHFREQLSDQILQDLEITTEGGAGQVVLKLCNRSRGAGVVVVPDPVKQLNHILYKLLTPPEGRELALWFNRHAAESFEEPLGIIEEQCLHWWSNECPVFLAERCCHSLPVRVPELPQRAFDGTMRVAFVLRDSKTPESDPDDPGRFKVEWLGGYWKLPSFAKQPEKPDAALPESLEEARARVVSSFNSAEKRTAEVLPAHLQEVCAALAPALPWVFRKDALSVNNLQDYYASDPLFCAFALARAAAAVRISKLEESKSILMLAGELLSPDPRTLAERSVRSYIDRNMAVCHMMERNMKLAKPLVLAAARQMQTNSTAHFIEGCYYEEQGDFTHSTLCLRKSIALDPDFKLPYLLLGSCLLRLGKFRHTVQVCQACHLRHCDSAVAHFNLGQALYHLAHSSQLSKEEEEKAVESLRLAKAQVSEQWMPADEGMLQYFLTEPSARPKLKRQPIHTWKVSGWRP
eukprot:TRINITY_DN33615_c0_g1_i1.p1 TRINITY_DN33615_c0_g1~~TRINITY_DN33615_c0_g1_i1.p1  ORF type:complete len:894 (+),score=157.95 TRINITY_DN33615_c0_g1_i1:135-2816(+)